MENRGFVIGCSIVAAACYGIVSYGHFYRGQIGAGWVFVGLSAIQLAIAGANARIIRMQSNRDSEE